MEVALEPKGSQLVAPEQHREALGDTRPDQVAGAVVRRQSWREARGDPRRATRGAPGGPPAVDREAGAMKH